MAKIINRNNIYEHLLEKQFMLVERTMLDALFDKNWREEWRITKAQSVAFEKYAIPLIKKVFKCNKQKALSTFTWFKEMHSLKIKD